jgi:cyanophycinase
MRRDHGWSGQLAGVALVWLLAAGAIPGDEIPRELFSTISEDFPANLSDGLDPAGIRGALLLAGGGSAPQEAWERFRELSGPGEPHLVVVPTAGDAPDRSLTERQREQWLERGFANVSVLHLETKEEADSPAVSEVLQRATAVWLSGGDQARVTERYLGTEVEAQLAAVLERGGVIGGMSAGAAVMSRVMIAGGSQQPRLTRGFDWLPDAIVDQHFSERQREPRLRAAVQQHPTRWGIGIDEGTAVVVRGRRLQVVGDRGVTICLARTDESDEVFERFEAGAIIDLTAWRRAARQRLEPPFPARHVAPATVEQGSLVIVGGGRLPRGLISRFLELAGGNNARIVILPTAMPDPLPSEKELASLLTRAGAVNVKVLRERERDAVESQSFLDEIEQATGVWFGGGRQWRFVDAYEGTRAHRALLELLQRGGVIGGSSAGASIQAEYLVRGNPLGNEDMMARGYERGLGFLPGTAIDQHFTQRNRARDLAGVIARYPQLLGIGIDEETALIVQGHRGEVVGRGAVYFFSSPGATATSVPSGGKYDLKARCREESPGKHTEVAPGGGSP